MTKSQPIAAQLPLFAKNRCAEVRDANGKLYNPCDQAPFSVVLRAPQGAVKPVAVRCVWQVHAAMPHVPILGMGGVASGLDALELVLAGAAAVSVGTAVFGDPSAPVRVLAELTDALAARGFTSLADAVGYAHRAEGVGHAHRQE